MFRNIIEKFTKKKALSQQAIAELINTTPEALQEFEKAYRVARITRDRTADTVLPDTVQPTVTLTDAQEASIDHMTENIVNDLLAQAAVWSTNDTKSTDITPVKTAGNMIDRVNSADIAALPADYRPQLTGTSMSVDLQQPSSPAVLYSCNNISSAATAVITTCSAKAWISLTSIRCYIALSRRTRTQWATGFQQSMML